MSDAADGGSAHKELSKLARKRLMTGAIDDPYDLSRMEVKHVLAI